MSHHIEFLLFKYQKQRRQHKWSAILSSVLAGLFSIKNSFNINCGRHSKKTVQRFVVLFNLQPSEIDLSNDYKNTYKQILSTFKFNP